MSSSASIVIDRGSSLVEMSELEINLELKNIALKIMKEIIATNDKALVANLVDFSKKVIVSEEHLTKLLKTAIGPETSVVIISDEEERSCSCCSHKVNIHPFAKVRSITIDGDDLGDAQPCVKDFIMNELNISLERIYRTSFISVERTE